MLIAVATSHQKIEEPTVIFLCEQQQTLVASQSGKIVYLKESIAPDLKFHRDLMHGETIQAYTQHTISTHEVVENQRISKGSHERGTQDLEVRGAYEGNSLDDSFFIEQYEQQDPLDEAMLVFINQHDGCDGNEENIHQESPLVDNYTQLRSDSEINAGFDVFPHTNQDTSSTEEFHWFESKNTLE
ncbi:hypothetical protein BGZ60DRAFT_406371 [Tricladium varicosporioides]|nr:hypothetical protein BGZ60DRAFT_406371 [Hymenoscyphus varicosporioides]